MCACPIRSTTRRAAHGCVAACLDSSEDLADALADELVRDCAATQQGRNFGGNGRIEGCALQYEAAQVDGRRHGTSFSMGRMRMPDAPAALSFGRRAQT